MYKTLLLTFTTNPRVLIVGNNTGNDWLYETHPHNVLAYFTIHTSNVNTVQLFCRLNEKSVKHSKNVRQ